MTYNCTETLQRAYFFLDGEVLNETERLEIRTHLEECRPCLERYGLDEEVARIVARLRAGQRCPPRLRIRIQALFE
ncbi:MAG: mycothiol system anti-sigma-R factor [Actinomycetota bacterium]